MCVNPFKNGPLKIIGKTGYKQSIIWQKELLHSLICLPCFRISFRIRQQSDSRINVIIVNVPRVLADCGGLTLVLLHLQISQKRQFMSLSIINYY